MMVIWAPGSGKKLSRSFVLRGEEPRTERLAVVLRRDADDLVHAHLDLDVLHVDLGLGDQVGGLHEAVSARRISSLQTTSSPAPPPLGSGLTRRTCPSRE